MLQAIAMRSLLLLMFFVQGSVTNAQETVSQEQMWLGVYVGAIIPGYEIVGMSVRTFPAAHFAITTNVADGKFLIPENLDVEGWRKGCVAIVNFRAELALGELRNTGQGLSITNGSGVIRLYYGDCVTKVRKLSDDTYTSVTPTRNRAPAETRAKHAGGGPG